MATAKNILWALYAVLILIEPVSGLNPPAYWEYRPGSKINDISVSDTGIAAVALQDNAILLLDREKKERQIQVITTPRAVAISADGDTIVVGAGSILAKYDTAGNLIWSKKLENTINKISLSNTTSIAVAANCNKQNAISECNTTYLFDKDGALIWAQLKTWGAIDIDIAPDGKYLLVRYEVKKSFLVNQKAEMLFEVKSSITTDGQMFDAAVFSGGNIAAGFQEGLRIIDNYFDSEPRASSFYRTDAAVVGVDSAGTGKYIAAIARKFEQGDYASKGGYDFRGCCTLYLVDSAGSLGWKQQIDYWVSSVAISASGRYAVAYSDDVISFFDNSANVVQPVDQPPATPTQTMQPSTAPPTQPPTTEPGQTSTPKPTETPEISMQPPLTSSATVPAATTPQPAAVPQIRDYTPTIQLIATLLAIIASAIGITTYYRSGKKRKRLFQYLVQIDAACSQNNTNVQCEKELYAIKANVISDFRERAIEENDYITLERKIGERLVEVRTKTVNERFGYLPNRLASLLAEIIRADKKVTREEYLRFMNVLSQTTGISYSQKKEIEKVLLEWVEKDREA